MLDVSNVTKRYGTKTAVRNVSFRVEQGEVVGLLGTNGAGKSTTMNIITGYLSATDGTVTVDGFDVLTEPKKAKARIGYLPEVPPLYQDMTVEESLNFIYDLKKVKLGKRTHLDEIYGLVQLSEMKHRLIRNLSKGYRQRVGIAAALIGNPPILILDEPTVGLDPKQIIEIRSLIKELSKTRTVILSSHILQEIEAVCGRIIIIDNGVIVADDTPEKLTARQIENKNVTIQLPCAPEKALQILTGLSGVKHVEAAEETESGVHRYNLDTGGADIRETLFFALAEQRIPLYELSMRHATLEDVFLQLTRQKIAPPEEETLPKTEAEPEKALSSEEGTAPSTHNGNKLSKAATDSAETAPPSAETAAKQEVPEDDSDL